MTDGPDKKTVEHLLALYIDNALSPEERAEFEEAMAADPLLRAEFELQNQIDASLENAFGAANVAKLDPFKQSLSWSRKLMRVAAVLFFVVSMFVLYRQYSNEFNKRPNTNLPSGYAQVQTTMQAYFDDAMTNGFEPGWICSGEQFDETFRMLYGIRIVLDDLPSNVKLSGLGYTAIQSNQTVALFVRVDDEPVLVFVDPASMKGELSPMNEGLHRYEKAMGKLLFYEVSRIEEPRVINHLSIARCKRRHGK